MSPTLEVGYKFNVSPYPLDMYGESDIFGSFTLNKTSIDEFKAAFGNPSQELETTYLNLTNSARHLQYNWGYAVFILENSAWQLVRVDMNSEIGTPPRGVGFGSTESEIVSVYKDFGQVEAPNGTRGLYYEYPNVGRCWSTTTAPAPCATAARFPPARSGCWNMTWTATAESSIWLTITSPDPACTSVPC